MKLFDASHVRIHNLEDGCFSFVTRDPDLLDNVKEEFYCEDLENVLVKIFHYPLVLEPHKFRWGKAWPYFEIGEKSGSPLLQSLAIQNLFADRNLAPRAYRVFAVTSPRGTKHMAVLVDDLGERWANEHNDGVYGQLIQVANELDIELPFCDMWTHGNVVGGKWVDWQGSKFGKTYLTGLKQRYLDSTYFGDSKYQTVPEAGLEVGIRRSEVRYKELGLDKIDFEDAKVIDIGCSGGVFLNYADHHGASYCVGLDWGRVIQGASEMSNYLGHFGIEYIAHDLNKPLPERVKKQAMFDVIIFTSMITHVGVPKYLDGLGKTMVLEINHDYQVEKTIKELESRGWLCLLIGKASDHGDRSIYHCKYLRFAMSGLED